MALFSRVPNALEENVEFLATVLDANNFNDVIKVYFSKKRRKKILKEKLIKHTKRLMRKCRILC